MSVLPAGYAAFCAGRFYDPVAILRETYFFVRSGRRIGRDRRDQQLTGRPPSSQRPPNTASCRRSADIKAEHGLVRASIAPWPPCGQVAAAENTGAPAGLLRTGGSLLAMALLSGATYDATSAAPFSPLCPLPSLCHLLPSGYLDGRVARRPRAGLRRARRRVGFRLRQVRGKDASGCGDPSPFPSLVSSRDDATRPLRLLGSRVTAPGGILLAGPPKTISSVRFDTGSDWGLPRGAETGALTRSVARPCRPSTRGHHESGMGAAAAAGATIPPSARYPPPHPVPAGVITVVVPFRSRPKSSSPPRSDPGLRGGPAGEYYSPEPDAHARV